MARSNRLPVLAAEIRKAHADVQEAAKTAAQRAIEAGHALIEAKDLLPHGGWLPWPREHCALAERTAQLYMKIARSGIESATVADLGLQAASRAIVGYIDYWSELNDPELIEWRIRGAATPSAAARFRHKSRTFAPETAGRSWRASSRDSSSSPAMPSRSSSW